MKNIKAEDIENTHQKVMETGNYGKEDKLITECFKKFKENTDINIVAMKIGLIDITNSTHISQHKSLVSAYDIAEHIVSIKDIDKRLQEGDPLLVSEIARVKGHGGEINLFSFASKYCCYHNKNVYSRDDYSIYDNVLKDNLKKYFDDIKPYKIDKWRKAYDYKSYNDYITNKLDELGIHIKFRKRKFDHYIWFNERTDKNK